MQQVKVNNSDLKSPPQFHVTRHGAIRLEKRLKCHTGKYMKVVRKAWKSKEKMSPKVYKKVMSGPSRGEHDIYRYYMGYIFVFIERKIDGEKKKLLVTLYNPKTID